MPVSLTFSLTEIQGCGAQSEDPGGGWLGAGEKVLRGHGDHATQESGGCQGAPGPMIYRGVGGELCPSPCPTKMTLTDVVAQHSLTHITLFLPHECLPCILMSQKVLVKEEMMGNKGRGEGWEGSSTLGNNVQCNRTTCSVKMDAVSQPRIQ